MLVCVCEGMGMCPGACWYTYTLYVCTHMCWYASMCIRIFMCVDICVYRDISMWMCACVCEPDVVIRNHCQLLSTSHTEAASRDERGTHRFGWCSSLLTPETPLSPPPLHWDCTWATPHSRSLSHGLWGSKLPALILHCKHFACWSISRAGCAVVTNILQSRAHNPYLVAWWREGGRLSEALLGSNSSASPTRSSVIGSDYDFYLTLRK